MLYLNQTISGTPQERSSHHQGHNRRQNIRNEEEYERNQPSNTLFLQQMIKEKDREIKKLNKEKSELAVQNGVLKERLTNIQKMDNSDELKETKRQLQQAKQDLLIAQ